ncbi:hypothetical protein HIM_05513 [Hirsutella minnesotensis 3608]|uniref:Ams2/SPT21 N-terminal domain-containing protein n=1 Tax=Hirsutella minnesotensis 3608 TaxID=1043627 RepID=A0A0F8A032_9HYPO|nr:hypothetical protein HIM_05513 [Hirsutella minnesotensis 3608]
MATPRPTAHSGGDGWNGSDQAMFAPAHAPTPGPAPESGLQVRPMGLKIHYTFDKEAKINCLARHSHTLNVQTIPLDETNTIGVIDLRACIHAVIECSPELFTPEGDYTVYAVDYSETDTPLVGQGMLSWVLESMRGDTTSQPPKLVTGRVTKNLLAVFGGGNKETLEVRLKFSESARVFRHVPQARPELHRPVDQPMEHYPSDRPMEAAMTPTGVSEWNSLMQANPQLGRPEHTSRVASPALSHGPTPQASNVEPFAPIQQQQNLPYANQEVQRVAPTPVDSQEQPRASAPSSRPSSRASNRAPRKRAPTGRPRGRPRKKLTDGNTSGYEEVTEGEEGPTRKRAKTTKADKSATNPFAAGTESLRVAASTSGSIRNFRPVGATNEGPAVGHLQEVPRAPTPVPDGANLPGRGPQQPRLRQGSSLGQHQAAVAYSDSRLQPLSPGQEDGRSPESIAPTPAYSDDSIASSPPVHRTASFMRSSPPPSSPILPPMPATELQHHDSGFGQDEVEDLFGEEALQAAAREAATTRVRAGKTTEPRMTKGVPIQVFQMQDGPTGQDMVHICSYNGAPHPTSEAPAHQQMAQSDAPSLPPLKKDPPRSRAKKAPAAKKSRAATVTQLPAMEPTPPPTTDALEKRPSPEPRAEASQHGLAPSPLPAAEISQEMALPEHLNGSPQESSESAPNDPPLQQQEQSQNSSWTKPPKRTAPISTSTGARTLVRSQSAGALASPSVPASEPAGPSSLSQSFGPEPSPPSLPATTELRRAASSGPLALPIPASDPVGPSASFQQVSTHEAPEATMPPNEALPMASSPPPARSNKNRVKKHAIKQRLEEAIMNGEMPPFCSNCGAIETPTWRKIWVQDKKGTPEYCEYSEKPGRVTAIEITERDEDEKPTSYRLIKKSLGPSDDKTAWQELLLCNPCGIWLTKCKCHRPPDRWDKDFSRIGQERRRKGTGSNNSRPRKPRSKADVAANPTSDAYFLTDALGPVEPSSPKAADGSNSQRGSGRSLDEQSRTAKTSSGEADSGNDDGIRSNPGSTHSRGSGTAKSPVELEFDEVVGSTKRLLFPSPRKDGVAKVLGEVQVNMIQISDDFQQLKRLATDKENREVAEAETDQDVGMQALRSPTIARPSTPPPGSQGNAHQGPFKTPTRATPSHRPITRSVSRSLRSIRIMASPSQVLPQQTPTKTPRLGSGLMGSALVRRSPRNHQGEFHGFDTPISRSLSQIFSDPNTFDIVDNMDLGSLPAMDENQGGLIDFGNLLSTDALVPSSPSRDTSIGFDYRGSANVWAQWTLEQTGCMQVDEEGDA